VSPPAGSSPLRRDGAVNRPLVVVALMLSMAMAAMEMTIVSTAMPTIVGELGGLPLYAWVAAVYLLTSTVTVPLYGKAADLFGRKPVLLAGIAMFLMGSVACALASSMPGLIVARALQGLGAGAMQPIALTIIGDLFTVRERGRIQPWFGAVWGVAGLAGPMVGGVLVKHLSWPWVFWINLPVGIAAMAVLSVALVERVERRRVRLDVAGAVLLSGAVVALLLAVEGVATVPLVALSLGLFVALVLVERRAPEPLVPLDLFTTRVLGLSNGLSALQGGIMIAVAVYVPLFVQAIVRGTPTEAGSAIAPMLVAWPIAAFVAGRALPRTGYRPLIVLGFLLIAASSVALPWLARPDASVTSLQLLSAVMGAGMGLASTALIIVVQSAVPWERRGVATASNMFSRTIGGTLAVGVLGAALARVVGAEADVSPEVMQGLLVHGGGGAVSSVESARLSAALANGIEVVFDAIAVLGVVGAVVALFFPALRVDPVATAKAHAVEV
jgi:EmrB/QacA subfamily drug resistance transporter